MGWNLKNIVHKISVLFQWPKNDRRKKNGYLSWFVLKYVDNTKQTSMEYFDLIHTISPINSVRNLWYLIWNIFSQHLSKFLDCWFLIIEECEIFWRVISTGGLVVLYGCKCCYFLVVFPREKQPQGISYSAGQGFTVYYYSVEELRRRRRSGALLLTVA